MQPLIITHTVDLHGRPLSIVHNLPGLDAEFPPDRLESLGRQLIYAAHDARSGAQGEHQYPEGATATRHDMTPNYLEYPTLEESCDFEPVGIDSEGGSHD